MRALLDDLYDDMTTIAFVQSVATPSEAATDFIVHLNALIDETASLYNLRKGVAKGKKKPADDHPVTE